MVRGRLAGDPDPGGLGRLDRVHRLDRREVLDVDRRLLVGGERRVAGDHRRLRDRWHAGEPERRRDRALVHRAARRELRILLVQRDRQPDEALVLKRAAHHPGAGDRQAVVGEADRAGVGELGHLGQLRARHPAGDAGRGTRPAPRPRSRAPLAQRRDRRRRCRPAARCWPSRGSRSSRPRPPRGCRSRGPPRPRARGCAGGRAGRRRPGSAVRPSASTTRRRRRRPCRPTASSAIAPSRMTTSQSCVDAARAGSSTRASRDHQLGAGLVGASSPVQRGDRAQVSHQAGSPIGVGAGSSASRRGAARPPVAGEQLVEDRHPHDQAALDLGGDQRGRRVDHLRRELDAAVDRPGVHQQLARAEPARVDLVARGVLADRGDEDSSIRSRCIRSA